MKYRIVIWYPGLDEADRAIRGITATTISQAITKTLIGLPEGSRVVSAEETT